MIGKQIVRYTVILEFLTRMKSPPTCQNFPPVKTHELALWLELGMGLVSFFSV